MSKHLTDEEVNNMIERYQELIEQGYKNKQISNILGIRYGKMNHHLKKHDVWVDTRKRAITFKEYKEARRSTTSLEQVRDRLKINWNTIMDKRLDWDVVGDKPEDYQPGGIFYDKEVDEEE